MSRTYTADTFPVTLKLSVLDKRPVVTIPRTYHVSTSAGAACYGDPPGYPSYFVRAVYTSHGNSPPFNSKCPDYVLLHPDGTFRGVPGYDHVKAFYQRIYDPLPVDHPRVQAWITESMQHLCHCYVDEERPEYNRPGTLIYPIPAYKLRMIPSKHPDIRVRSAEDRASREFNRAEEERAAKLATVDNHMGVRRIREFYPDWTPDRPVDSYRVLPRPGDWWETLDTAPTPDTCPGIHGNPHRTEGWCQFCGHTTAAATAEAAASAVG